MRKAGVLMAEILVISMAGCANPYEKFFQIQPAPVQAGFLPPAGPPHIQIMASDPREEIISMFENGYGLIGTAAFDSPEQNPNNALGQAKKVGAEIVSIKSAYRDTTYGVIPMTHQTTSTSYNTGNATISGPGGVVYGNYSGTTTTYGSATSLIPYSINLYDHLALFFGPMERKGIGLWFDNATDEQRKLVGTNQLLLVIAVRRGSPAFLADIFAGDLVLTIDGHPIFDRATMQQAIRADQGETEVTLIRDGKRMTKKLIVPAVW